MPQNGDPYDRPSHRLRLIRSIAATDPEIWSPTLRNALFKRKFALEHGETSDAASTGQTLKTYDASKN